MAVAYASSNSAKKLATASDPDTLVITKPTGLAAGDLMIFIGSVGASAGTYTSTGWTSENTVAIGTSARLTVLMKIADSTDAAATDFTFSVNATENHPLIGFLMRITGSSFTNVDNIESSLVADTNATTNKTFTPGVTPQAIGTLFILGSYARANTTQGTYAITNNNPTWTEQLDTQQTGGTEAGGLAVATATSTSASATGDFTLVLASSAEAVGFLLSVQETVNVTVTPAVITATASVQAPTVSGGASVSPAVITATASVQAPTVTIAEAKWKNPDKSSTPSFVNPDKS